MSGLRAFAEFLTEAIRTVESWGITHWQLADKPWPEGETFISLHDSGVTIYSGHAILSAHMRPQDLALVLERRTAAVG